MNRCENCLHLHYKTFEGGLKGRVEDIAYRCQKGHFDRNDKYLHELVPQYYAWGGIVQPNRAVAGAQEKCGEDYEPCAKVAWHRQEEKVSV